MTTSLSSPSQDAMAHISLWAEILSSPEIDSESYSDLLDMLVKGRRREHLIKVIQYLACEAAALLEVQAELTGKSLSEVLSAEAAAKAMNELETVTPGRGSPSGVGTPGSEDYLSGGV